MIFLTSCHHLYKAAIHACCILPPLSPNFHYIMASTATHETDFFLKKLSSIPKAMGHDDLELTRSKPIYRYTTSQGSSSLSSPYQHTPDLLSSFQPQVSQRHSKLVLQEWSKVDDLLRNSKGEGILLDGSSLDIPQVAAVAR